MQREPRTRPCLALWTMFRCMVGEFSNGNGMAISEHTICKSKQVKKAQSLKTDKYGLSCLLHAWMYYCIFASNFQPFCGLFAYYWLPHWRDASGVPNVQLSRLSGVGLPLPLPRPCCRWKPALLWVFNLPPESKQSRPRYGEGTLLCYMRRYWGRCMLCKQIIIWELLWHSTMRVQGTSK